MADVAPTPTDASTPNSSSGGGAANEVVEIVKTIVYALLIALVLRVILFQPFTIPSESMEPALLKGDYIIVSKYSYGWSHHSIPFSPPIFHGRVMGKVPARGDIIVFKLPRDGRTDYIKRLIGLPGDRVQVVDGQVMINGVPIPRQPMGPTQDPGNPAMTVMQYKETMSDGKTYTTFDQSPAHDGDNTDVYIVPQGHYFFMGDNRDNSLDSRWPKEIGVGFVPAENVVGKAQIILLSWSDGASLFKPWTWFTKAQPKRFFHRLQ
jgi:signal peptidase I